MDEKISNSNLFKKRNFNTKFGVSFTTNNNSNNRSMVSDDAFVKNKLNEKELNNAVNMIRILTNDNKRFRRKVIFF